MSAQQQTSRQEGMVYHDFKVEYPVLDLLPSDRPVTPTLDEAAWPGFREKPDPRKYNLPLSGTDFAVRLPLENASLMSDPPVVLEGDHFFSTVVRLLTFPGNSVLQAATYFDREHGEVYKFRFSMATHTHDIISGEAELRKADWIVELARFRSENWMMLVRDLLDRFTDRAYWHVHWRVAGYRWYQRQVEDEVWDFKETFDAQRFLAQQFAMVPRSCDVGSEDDEYDLHLPCGHQQVVVFKQMKAMSAGACLHYCCKACDELVVHDGLIICRTYLYLQQAREARERFCAREANWLRLAYDVPVSDRPIRTTGGLLAKALHSALESMVVPESVSQHSLQLVGNQVFSQVLRAFWAQFAGRDFAEINGTASRLYQDLVQKLDRAIGVGVASPHEFDNLWRVPFIWLPQLRVWLARGVQLAGVPGYDGSDLVAVIGQYAVPAEEVLESDDEMDELEEMMDSADRYYN